MTDYEKSWIEVAEEMDEIFDANVKAIWEAYVSVRKLNRDFYHEHHEYDKTLEKAESAAFYVWLDIPRRIFAVQIAWGVGKVHRIGAPSPQFIDQPFCGSSRWNSARARIVDAEITCQKCLR